MNADFKERTQDDDAEDLYGDLVAETGAQGGALLTAELENLKSKTADQASQIRAYELTIAQLTEEVEALRQDKATLMTNFSSMFSTARLEVERKNEAIVQLRERAEKAETASKHMSAQLRVQ